MSTLNNDINIRKPPDYFINPIHMARQRRDPIYNNNNKNKNKNNNNLSYLDNSIFINSPLDPLIDSSLSTKLINNNIDKLDNLVNFMSINKGIIQNDNKNLIEINDNIIDPNTLHSNPSNIMNVYSNLPIHIINEISKCRDTILTGTKDEKAQQLHELDKAMPEWINVIKRKNVQNITSLRSEQIYVFCVLNNVPIDRLEGLNSTTIIQYARLHILLNSPSRTFDDIFQHLLKNVERAILILLAVSFHNIDVSHVKFISDNEFRLSLLHRDSSYINLKDISNRAYRYSSLFDHKYSHLIDLLYNTEFSESNRLLSCQSSPHPMESIIINLDSYTDKQLIDYFGMVIPLNAGNVHDYIINNIVDYKYYVSRNCHTIIPKSSLLFTPRDELKSYFQQLNDKEIFQSIGVYIPYFNRSSLINGIISTFTEHQFMFRYTISNDCSINQTTLLGTDINDTTTFMVCYGTCLKYHTYELAELQSAFYEDDDTLIVQFRRPHNPKELFTLNDIDNLQSLLQSFPPTPDITSLFNKINHIMISLRDTIESDLIIKNNFTPLLPTDKTLFNDFLKELFFTGMYMRKWLGPGHPYPIDEQSTLDKHYSPDYNVSVHLTQCQTLINSMSNSSKKLYKSLFICQYNNKGTIDVGREKFKSLFDIVIKGEECIRMASTRFIGTGYHYLRILFKYTIPDINISKLERIV